MFFYLWHIDMQIARTFQNSRHATSVLGLQFESRPVSQVLMWHIFADELQDMRNPREHLWMLGENHLNKNEVSQWSHWVSSGTVDGKILHHLTSYKWCYNSCKLDMISYNPSYPLIFSHLLGGPFPHFTKHTNFPIDRWPGCSCSDKLFLKQFHGVLLAACFTVPTYHGNPSCPPPKATPPRNKALFMAY